jgi:hypothetical protein
MQYVFCEARTDFLNIQNYNFACSFVWVWNFVPDIKGAEKNIWTEKGWNGMRLEKTA